MSQITSLFLALTRLVCAIGITTSHGPRNTFKTNRKQMVEVFKTNVEKHSQARLLTDLICLAFTGYRASFDLEDCDRVLRISCEQATICNGSVIGLLESFGYEATVMEDAYSAFEHPCTVVQHIHSITI